MSIVLQSTFRIVLMMNRSSCDKKKTLPDLPGDGSSRRAWSPVSTIQGFASFQELLLTDFQAAIPHPKRDFRCALSLCRAGGDTTTDTQNPGKHMKLQAVGLLNKRFCLNVV